MKIFTTILFFSLFHIGLVCSQTATKTFTLTFAYLGEMGLHPGAVVGMEYPLFSFSKDEAAASQHQLRIGLQAGSYQQLHAFNTLFATPQIGYEFQRKRTRRNGKTGKWFVGLTGGWGWVGTIYKGNTYSIIDGAVTSNSLETDHAPLLTGRFYGGGRLAKISKIHLSWYASATYQQIGAANDGKIHQPAVEFGLRWELR